MSNLRIAAGTLAAIGGRLYGTVRLPAREQFVRLDPQTGAVVARSAPIRRGVPYGPPVAAAGLVWFQSRGSARLLGLDPVRLERRAVVNVHLPTGAKATYPAALASGPGADTLLVGGQYRVAFVDARRARVHRYLNVPGQVTGVALSPDGSRLYISSTPVLSVDGTISTLDPHSGAVLASTDVGEPALGLQATTGGVWMTVAGGHVAHIEFRPDPGEAPSSNLAAGVSGGGEDVLPTISGGVAWLGGYGSAACADPDTGRLRARTTRTAHRRGYLSSITVAAGRVYALFGLGSTSRLVTLRPPAACGVR